MSYKNQFAQELNKLFEKRVHWLKSSIGARKIGQPPKFNRKTVGAGIESLQKIVSDSLAQEMFNEECRSHVVSCKYRKITGYGADDKKKIFKLWLDKHFPKRESYVYIFWGEKNKCIYVGRTTAGGDQPTNHFKVNWFGMVKRVEILMLKSKGKACEMECLAIHYYKPLKNKNKASSKKWTKVCPICKIHRTVEKELRSIFSFRK